MLKKPVIFASLALTLLFSSCQANQTTTKQTAPPSDTVTETADAAPSQKLDQTVITPPPTNSPERESISPTPDQTEQSGQDMEERLKTIDAIYNELNPKVKTFKFNFDWQAGYAALAGNAVKLGLDVQFEEGFDQSMVQYNFYADSGEFILLEDGQEKHMGRNYATVDLDKLFWSPVDGEAEPFSQVNISVYIEYDTKRFDFKDKVPYRNFYHESTAIIYNQKSKAYYTFNDGFPSIVNYKDGTYVFPALFSLKDYSLESLIQTFGNDYTTAEDENGRSYTYKNGVILLEKDGQPLLTVGPYVFAKMDETLNLRLIDDMENKRVFIYGGNVWDVSNHIILYDINERRVLADFATGPVDTIDMDSDGIYELLVEGYADGVEEEKVCKIIDNQLVVLFDLKKLDAYIGMADFKVEGNTLSLKMDSLSLSSKSTLPGRLFNQSNRDKMELRVEKEYSAIQTESGPRVKCLLTIGMPIGGGDYGPSYSEYIVHYCDLARITLIMQYTGSDWQTTHAELIAKYPETAVSEPDPVSYDETWFGDKLICMGGNVKETIVALGGKVEDYTSEELDGYLSSVSVGGVKLDLFLGGMICSYDIYTDKYPSARGLKVGDSRDKVRALYGEPDVGFLNTDAYISYYVNSGTPTGTVYENSTEFQIRFDGDTVKSMGIYEFCTD